MRDPHAVYAAQDDKYTRLATSTRGKPSSFVIRHSPYSSLRRDLIDLAQFPLRKPKVP